uniref:Uncharacterized protein n=1 Tax=Anopheles farauti TaxID=69004 RepID=A0A182QV70_9DIPT
MSVTEWDEGHGQWAWWCGLRIGVAPVGGEGLPPHDISDLSEPAVYGMREIELTLGTLFLSHTPSDSSRSRISHAKMPGSFCFSSRMYVTTFGVVTRGFEPPIAPGRIEPVSWYRARIFDTQPWLTRSWRDMSHGRIPSRASSTMRIRVLFGSGRPFTNTPPSWFTSPYCCAWFSPPLSATVVRFCTDNELHCVSLFVAGTKRNYKIKFIERRARGGLTFGPSSRIFKRDSQEEKRKWDSRSSHSA